MVQDVGNTVGIILNKEKKMDKDIDALIWDLVYGYITSHPREAAERIANFVKAPERLYLLEHKKDKGEKKKNGKCTAKQTSGKT